MSLVASGDCDPVQALLKPVDLQAPAGLFDPEDETYQAIDHEMVKLGGLHQASIDWLFVEEASSHYLATRCKHLRVVGHLLNAWSRAGRWDTWSASVKLLMGMIEHYWQSSYPKPGPTGFPAKRRQVSGLFELLGRALPSLVPACERVESLRLAGAAMARLQKCTAVAHLDPAALSEFSRSLTRHDGQGEPPAPPVNISPVATRRTSAEPLSHLRPPGTDRDSRRAAMALADLINEQDIYDPAGYLLRRFALWGHIQNAPLTQREVRTELTPVPAELVATYNQALTAHLLEPPLLMRLERSVAASPFWIRGSHLAALVAARLAMEEVAEAIRLTSLRFVRRLPRLMTLQFSDGTAFVDEQTQAWLTAPRHSAGKEEGGPEYQVLREELMTQLSREGMESVLLRLQSLQVGQGTPRQRCHASVVAADLLEARGLSWLANDLYANAARAMAQSSADEWEPDLYRRLLQQGKVQDRAPRDQKE